MRDANCCPSSQTKNPEKYNKNMDRNRRREIEVERRNIYKQAISQAERLAAIHDPTGKMFNIGPVVVQNNGEVISVEALERRAKSREEREARLAALAAGKTHAKLEAAAEVDPTLIEGINPARQHQIAGLNGEVLVKRLSNNQQKKLALLEERPTPLRPVIPEGIEIPEGEENWLVLW